MAAGDAVQVGEVYLIGIGNAIYETHTIKALTYSKDGTTIIHTDIRGATDSILTMNPMDVLQITVDIVGAATDFAPPVKNSLISMKGPDDDYPTGWRVEGSAAGSEGIAQWTLTLTAEDSMGAEFNDDTQTKTDDWDISDDADHAETLTANGATDIAAVYGNGVVMTEATDWSYDTATKILTIESTYIGTILEDPADELVLKICPNYGPALTLTLTAIA